jgi:hypothetical protein
MAEYRTICGGRTISRMGHHQSDPAYLLLGTVVAFGNYRTEGANCEYFRFSLQSSVGALPWLHQIQT